MAIRSCILHIYRREKPVFLR